MSRKNPIQAAIEHLEGEQRDLRLQIDVLQRTIDKFKAQLGKSPERKSRVKDGPVAVRQPA